MRRYFTQTERMIILSRNNFRCAYCGSDLTPPIQFHADHIIPVYAGGVTCVENGTPSCESCNLKKGSRHEKHTQSLAENSY